MVDSEQIEDWADEVLSELGRKETCWSIAQVSCPEEGCPPVETIITDLGVKGPKPGAGVYKIFKPIPEVTREDVERVLKSPDGGCGLGHGAAAGHGPAAGHAGDGHGTSGHAADGSCCDGHGTEGHEGHGAGHEGQGHG
eukprot:TRINITY_DN66815_c0_g1_i1.p1 TRINITY_DN66815_c0_g1~~TRINITY_DN66815_c0_g1_i1.p1  ORF type:complete len:161 (-),score=40.39 TRINITY_DN66815_c0_g1_i1:159-575(-)